MMMTYAISAMYPSVSETKTRKKGQPRLTLTHLSQRFTLWAKVNHLFDKEAYLHLLQLYV
jgi:hypothetical protein